jgi:hypothetical protein
MEVSGKRPYNKTQIALNPQRALLIALQAKMSR